MGEEKEFKKHFGDVSDEKKDKKQCGEYFGG